MISPICGLEKIVLMNLFTKLKYRLADIQNKLMVIKGEGLGGGINWEYVINRCTLPYIK